jgi:small-conductance mechanosensitive channel
MPVVLTDAAAIWALILVIVLPIAIVGAGELEERLRQRDSEYTRVVSVVRGWVIPFFAAWALAGRLFGLSDEALITQVLGTGLALSTTWAALILIRIIVARLVSWSQAGERARIPQILLALPRIGVLIAAGWILVDTVWGVDLSAALAALGVTSLIVSFALQDTLSGLASGLLLLGDSPFQPGDWIQSGDLVGKVVDINWRSSRIVDRNGDLHVVPNAQLAGAEVVNFYAPNKLHRVVMPVQVAYVNPPTLAKEMLLDAARSTEGVLEDPPPVVRVVQIDDPLMGYEVQMWISDYQDAPRVSSDFGSLVWYQSHRHDVPLPSPAYDLYMYDGIQAGLAGTPDRAEVRRRLRAAPLLDSLSEDDLDRMAAASSTVRFARGERILELSASDFSLHVLWTGSARMVVPGPLGGQLSVAELAAGDVFGLLGRVEQWTHAPEVVAVTDCEIVVVPADTASEIASQIPALASALNQVVATRRRRVDRMLRQSIGSGGDTAAELPQEPSGP